MPNITAKRIISVKDPADNERSLNTSMSSSGSACRRSQTTKVMAAPTPMTIEARDSGSVQPRSGPSWMPSTSPPMANIDRMEPTVSKRCSACSRELGTWPSVMNSDTATSNTGRPNSQRHDSTSTAKDETNRPTSPPLPATPAQMPMAWPRSSSGKLLVITDRVTGMIMAAPRPARIRAAIISPVEVANPAPRLAKAKTQRPATSTGLRPHRSPIAPTGMRSAARATV